MSASTNALQDELLITKPTLSVSFRLLLGLYAIIPLCLLLQLADSWFWQGQLKQSLPSSPNHFLLFQILFGTPHIIASTIVLVSNKDYLSHYRRKLLLMTAAIAIFFGIGSLFIPYRVLYVMVASWTVYHVLRQQHGIARGLCRLPNRAFQLLLWLSIFAGVFIYIGIFMKNRLDIEQVEWLKHVVSGLCISLVCASVLYQRNCPTAFSKCFLWGNTFLILSSFYFYLNQYYFLAILIPRLVHDATAYIFYVAHDYNKHRQQPQNRLYRYAAKIHLPIFLVLPLLSFALTYLLQSYGDQTISLISRTLFDTDIHKAVTLGLFGYLALMHYYTEAFTWKQDSPYRQFIAFKK